MNRMNPKVDAYLARAKKWQEEMATLRTIVLDCQLIEELKWRIPVYTFRKSNVVAISALKECFVLSFFKGALIQDADGILTKPGENTRSARVIRFTSAGEITETEPVLKAYIYQAIEIEKSGLKVDLKANSVLILPEEVQHKFDEHPALKAAFHALTPGRQRAYILYFSAPKQSKTKTSRIEKYAQQILDGKGLNDCTCGLSQKLPACDGSHKFIQ